ncbi:MAG: hypothetical protein JJ969_12385 [Rhizobiaceae bacterium]|nr:hypothetical protein [Rhizobiaceae bacterium]
MTAVTAVGPTIPRNATEAITFALDHLEGLQASDFLADWREGRNLQGWLDGRLADLRAGSGDWSDRPQGLGGRR